MSERSAPEADRPAVPCPICRRPSDPVLRPFCSKRCADVDLHRWLSGGYAIPAGSVASDDGSTDAMEADPNERP